MGNVRKIILACLFLSLAWIGCVKDPQDIPAGLTGNPVFGVSGSFNGQSMNIRAGETGWTDQPLVKEEGSSLVYTSIFSLDACTDDCKPSWEFRFYKAQSSSVNAEADFLQTIKTGSKEFVPSHVERDSFEVKLNTQSVLFMSGYSSWENLNDSITTLNEQFNDVVGYGEVLNVCFQSLAFPGCNYNQCIYFKPSTLVPCIASVHAKYEDTNTISVTVRPEMGTPPFNVLWYDESEGSSILLFHQDSIVDFYVRVTVTDALGNRSELRQTIRLQDSTIDACYFPISLVSTPVENTSPSLLSDRAEIIYTDENGMEWSSTAGIQPDSSYLNIGSVEYFGLSPLQQPAYKTALSLSVKLFNAAGDSKLFEGQDVVLALGHR
ncbi:MAG TPA: hypothetical protein VFG10_07895 [Saprospiraceae bacterium]|nr:hypothetical protein [Saprospiraceae bacterium]